MSNQLLQDNSRQQFHQQSPSDLVVSHLDPSDYESVRLLHEKSAIDYKFPDLTSPLVTVRQVVRDKDGRILGAAALRLQAETFLWLDKDLPRKVRLRVVLALSRSMAVEAWRVGLDCVVACLPPGLPRSFLNTLETLGWKPTRDKWQHFVKELDYAKRPRSG